MISKSRPSVLGVIPARGGSKAVPRKNVRLLLGRPLVAYTIEVALATPEVVDVVLSTDDAAIRDLGLALGAQAPFLRPAELATDTALAVPTVQHAVQAMESARGGRYDYVVMLQPTAPLRTVEDLSGALRRLFDAGADGIVSVVDVDNFHPMKMKRFVDGRLVDYAKPPVENPPRQSLPAVFIVNGAIYATRRDVLMERDSFQGDHCLGHVMPAERSVNVDGELDFVLAEHLLARRRAAAPPASRRDPPSAAELHPQRASDPCG